MNEVNFDFLNEKIHPRKKLKGRSGFVLAGGKGSQRRIKRGKESFVRTHPNIITKYSNSMFHGKHGKSFDDGNLKPFNSRGVLYDRRTGNRFPIGYSANKRKRWKLMDRLNKEGGFHNYLPSSTKFVQDEIEEERETVDEKKEYLNALEKYSKMKKIQEKKEKVKDLPDYILDMKVGEFRNWKYKSWYERRMNQGYYNGLVEADAEKNNRDRKESGRRHKEKKKRREKKILHEKIKKLEKDLKDQEKKLSIRKPKQLLKGRKSRRMNKHDKEEKIGKLKFQKKMKKEMEREKTKERILENEDYYEFEETESYKKWARRPRENQKYFGRRDYNRPGNRKRDLRRSIKETLDLKY